MIDITRRTHDEGIKITRDRILENATEAILSLLDPDVEPRSVMDAINLLNAIEQAIEFVHARPEFLCLTAKELSAAQAEVLRRIHC